MEPKTYGGVVNAGQGRAAKLGYPTVNIPLPDADVSGVYVADVAAGGKRYRAAAFADPVRGVLEAHLIGFSGSLYGQTVSIALLSKLRGAARFADDAALSRAIAEDVARAGAYRPEAP